jgi:hypothetical protein
MCVGHALADVVNRELMTGFNQIERDGAAHVPESDKSNAHVSSPSGRLIAPGSCRGAAAPMSVDRAIQPSLKHQRGVGGKEKGRA